MSVMHDVRRFLELFDRNNRIHTRVLGMLAETCGEDELVELAEALMEGSANTENLRAVLQSYRLDGARETASFDGKRPTSELVDNEETHAADEAQEGAKRARIDGDGVNKYDGEEPGCIGNSFVEGIPGLNGAVHEARATPALAAGPEYLYLPLQCKLCGLRFRQEDTEAFGIHIDDHRRKTKALGEKTVLRREFFSSKALAKTEKLELEVEGNAEIIEWEKDCPVCTICRRPVKKVWNDCVENWVLENGVRVNNRDFAHKECVS